MHMFDFTFVGTKANANSIRWSVFKTVGPLSILIRFQQRKNHYAKSFIHKFSKRKMKRYSYTNLSQIVACTRVWRCVACLRSRYWIVVYCIRYANIQTNPLHCIFGVYTQPTSFFFCWAYFSFIVAVACICWCTRYLIDQFCVKHEPCEVYMCKSKSPRTIAAHVSHGKVHWTNDIESIQLLLLMNAANAYCITLRKLKHQIKKQTE